jgi:23S rRNA pseudouridine1911/1915/1917 synthase
LKINIIFEDNHLLVVEKPVNMPSQADLSGDLDLLSALKNMLKKKYNKPGNVYLGLVHRLDRPVGGLMVFAKTSKAAGRLSDQIRKKTFGKKYRALVEGIPKNEGKLVHFLKKDKKNNISEAKTSFFPESKEAILIFYILKKNKTNSYIEIELITGRSHQIRAQFSAIYHPLLGDKKYGSTQKSPNKAIALFSSYLAFEHPIKKEKMEFFLEPKWK